MFTNSINDFKLVDNINREVPIEQGIRLNQRSQEIVYNDFTSPNVYYWSLPSRYLGNKVTSYGGNLRYTLRHTPVPGGQSSRNSAADVELVSVSNLKFEFTTVFIWNIFILFRKINTICYSSIGIKAILPAAHRPSPFHF